MKRLVLMMVMCCFVAHINAQKRSITGTVTDGKLPLPGANVVIKGTNHGTQTDFDGKYQIMAAPGDKLVFNYIGFKTQEIEVKTAVVINVAMEEDANALEEVVVVGYGAQKVQYTTASVVRTPSAAQLKRQKKKAYHNEIARQLQGRVAGVAITSANGNQNNNKIVIRGAASIRKGKEPLFIVDGTPIRKANNAVIAKLSKDKIDKVVTYKGAKARQLFGTNAKNGCIVITTKSGNYQVENDEEYARLAENQFQKVNLNPLSTFAIDVDRASYGNIRRMLNNGESIPIDAVKIEEMINYFHYNYPQPKDIHPFSITTDLITTPWNRDTRLVRIGLQGKTYESSELPASNLTFLIDVSGSMDSVNKLPLLKSAFKLLVNQLREKDTVSIVVYAGAAGVVLEPTSGANKTRIIEALNALQAGGSTAGGAGIELAYSLAQKNFKEGGNNRVILATDGDFNVGMSSNRDMEQLIEEKRKSGVFLSVLGFGMGNYKDSKLEILADKGNGNHAYIDGMQEAQKVFGKEFGGTLFTIAKDVKIQVEFNPARVQAYRLIGYENRMLEDEDFVDDTKDAGELGSGHTVTALYEVIPTGVESSYIREVADLKYTQTEQSFPDSNELLTVKFRYKKPDESNSIEMQKVLEDELETVNPDFSFAAAVALFGMQLRKSQFDGEASLDDVISLAEAGRGIDQEGYRAEFIRLVKSYRQTLP